MEAAVSIPEGPKIDAGNPPVCCLSLAIPRVSLGGGKEGGGGMGQVEGGEGRGRVFPLAGQLGRGEEPIPGTAPI